MPTLADYFQRIKDEKEAIRLYLGALRYNHPHRLATISIAGNLSYVIDERDFTAPGLSAKRYTWTLDFADSGPYTRLFEERTPFIGELVPTGDPGIGHFYLTHQPHTFLWQFLTIYGDPTDYAIIGPLTTDTYTRPTTSDPWTLDSTAVEDVEHRFGFILNFGGEPDSGGKGDDSPDEEAFIQLFCEFDGPVANAKLPNFTVITGRLPWEDNWASESAGFATIFSDHLTTQNAADGGGHSGSCSIEVSFDL